MEIKLTIEKYEQAVDLLPAVVDQAERAIGKLITADLSPNMFSAL